ncbi:NUDIX hydrolase [Timonella sp. A28]|uniref:NUDIX hydrolase n=1 Tax=Timonella sp. A28 TaxID=3442640 RepID=UPI003EC0A26C
MALDSPKKKVQGGRVRGVTGVASPALENTPVIECAGAVIWRIQDAELQVLLIHRPRYDDWSWPKGKVDPGETLAAAAVREVKEETGKFVALGIALPGLQYITPEGALKRVHYWSARVIKKNDASVIARAPVSDVDETEVDASKWFSAKEAARKLSRAADKTPLAALVKAHNQGMLDTHVLAIARHGKALARSQWNGGESNRPLTPVGTAQAVALVPVLAAFGISNIVTSEWKRCSDTIRPYEEAAGVLSAESDLFTEASHERDPKAVAAAVTKLVHSDAPSVLCTHRPVLPTLFKTMGKSTPDETVRKAYPKADPYLAPGEILIAHIKLDDEGNDPHIVGLETIRPTLH